MKLTTVRRLSKLAFRLRQAAAEELKDDPTVKETFERANNFWMDLYLQQDAMEQARAEKADAGEVLFTIFVPGKLYVKEIVRTPNREITSLLWKRDHWNGTHSLERSTGSHVRVMAKSEDPYRLIKHPEVDV